jgi:SNF2 family DNA or RNA helicase
VEDSFFGKKIVGLTDSLERQQELIDLLEPFTIRNPDLILGKGKRVTEIPLTMGVKQKKLYKKIKDLLLDELPENCTILNGMAKMIRLQQTTTAPETYEVQENIKFDWVVEMCQCNPDTKFVIFSHFASSINWLKERLQLEEIGIVPYIGEMSTKERNASLETFKNTPVQVLAGTIGAMGQGIDGLQNVCHVAIFLDRDWSPALNEQAEDRLNRIGQKEFVDIYVLECIGTVDKYVGKININKTIDIRKVFDGNENISI